MNQADPSKGPKQGRNFSKGKSAYPFIDSHCHFDFSAFDDDREAVLKRCSAAGVGKIIIPAVKAESWVTLLMFCEEYSTERLQLVCGLGLHPFWTAEHQDSDFRLLRKVLQHAPEQLVAIGECGLDAVAAPELMERQIQLLRWQLELAAEFDLPVIFHVRKAHGELQHVLKDFPKISGVIHGFSGSYELAQSYIDLGMKLGIGGTITYPRAQKTRKAIAQLPLNALLLETDAPDMPMQGRQGLRNSPEYLREVFTSLTELRTESELEVRTQLWQNSQDLFARP